MILHGTQCSRAAQRKAVLLFTPSIAIKHWWFWPLLMFLHFLWAPKKSEGWVWLWSSLSVLTRAAAYYFQSFASAEVKMDTKIINHSGYILKLCTTKLWASCRQGNKTQQAYSPRSCFCHKKNARTLVPFIFRIPTVDIWHTQCR